MKFVAPSEQQDETHYDKVYVKLWNNALLTAKLGLMHTTILTSCFNEAWKKIYCFQNWVIR